MFDYKTAAAYIRVSTDDQVELSPASQLVEIRKWASANGYFVPDEYVFVDEAKSGRKVTGRDDFRRLIATAKTKPKPFDAILLWKFSRFARNRDDAVYYKSILRKQLKIDVISIKEPIEEGKMGVIMESMIEAMDEYYSVNLGQEVRRGMQEKFKRGGVVSIPPFGYQVVEGHFVPDQVQAPYVSMIYQQFLAGSTCPEIARFLNDSGIRTSRGNPFDGRAIRYILTNPFYIGILRRQAHPTAAHDHFYQNTAMDYAQGTHVPLFSPALFEQVQMKLKNPAG